MLVPRKESDRVENVIERRFVETLVSGGVRPFDSARPVRKANPAGTGLFLVKPATVGSTRCAGESTPAQKARGRLEANGDRSVANSKTPARVLSMKLPEQQTRQERLLGALAALGPMLWFGHAVLIWLKVA